MVSKPFCPPGSKLIGLTQGQYAIVDEADYERLSRYKWHVQRSRNICYATRVERWCAVQMHRDIMDAPAGLVCDHINHNGLDNRKANLRVCTRRENSYNCRTHRESKSQYKGVNRLKGERGWRSRICKNYHRMYIGYFASAAEAALAYDFAADKLYGRFAYLNFPQFLDAEKWLAEMFNPPTLKPAPSHEVTPDRPVAVHDAGLLARRFCYW